MPLKIRVHEKVNAPYSTYNDFLKDYLKKLTPEVISALKSGWYGSYTAIPSKDGLTVLFVPTGYHLDLPQYIERDDAAKITRNAAKNHKSFSNPFYGAFELTWTPYYYDKNHIDTYNAKPYQDNTLFFLYGRKYGNGNAYDKTQFDVHTNDPTEPTDPKDLSVEIARELRV